MGQLALHYLDGLLIGASNSQKCAVALQTSLELCETLGVPIAAPKVEGPATVLPFFGILIDSGNGVPSVELLRLKRLICLWRGKKCKKRELLSQIGQLIHACRVICAGHIFLRCMIDLLSVPKERVCLNKGFQSDLLVGSLPGGLEWGLHIQ